MIQESNVAAADRSEVLKCSNHNELKLQLREPGAVLRLLNFETYFINEVLNHLWLNMIQTPILLKLAFVATR